MKCWACRDDYSVLVAVNVHDASTTPGLLQRLVCTECADRIAKEAERKQRVKAAYGAYRPLKPERSPR